MTQPRTVLLRAIAVLLALALPLSSADARQREHDKPKRSAPQEADPAVVAVLGAVVPKSRAIHLSSWLRVQPAPADPASPPPAEVSLFSVLRDAGSPGQARYEGSGLTLDLVTEDFGRLRIERARVALMPSSDGRTCRFEMSGSPFGAASVLEATGSIEWATGPLGGDRLDVTFRLGDAPVEAVRAFLPTRVDPSFRGLLNLAGKAAGVIGETTTEDMPATALVGQLEAAVDWQVLGRTAPLVVTTSFALDDRHLRIKDGRMQWEGLGLDVRGWVEPTGSGPFQLIGTFAGVDANKVAVDWNVPGPWRPTAVVSGSVTMEGTPGKSQMRYEAKAPEVVVPSLGGWTVRLRKTKITGSLLAVNAEISASFAPEDLQIGDFHFGALPFGLQWWRDALTVSAANTRLWDGDNAVTLAYKPAEHPKFTVAGTLRGAKVASVLGELAPWLGLETDGRAALSFALGQDEAGKPRRSVHASLIGGRIGNFDLFARTLDALAAADASLALPDAATLIPKPRIGTGMRVDTLFLETEQVGDIFELGGVLLRGGEFQLDGDGSYSRANGLKLDATVRIAPEVAARLLASAPWMSALRAGEAALYVPVVVTGPAAAPTLQLAAGYADLLGRARRGEPVVAPGLRAVRHVGEDNLATIQGDPRNVEY